MKTDGRRQIDTPEDRQIDGQTDRQAGSPGGTFALGYQRIPSYSPFFDAGKERTQMGTKYRELSREASRQAHQAAAVP